jgi:probable F420-dependent oxidoreductase
MADIRFGAFYTPGSGMEPGEFARRLEELGFDGFWCGESPNNRHPMLDTFATLCFAAAATSRITVGSDVFLTPLHHPAWLAKQIGSLDVLSHGRVIATLGVGGEYAKQFELFGIPVNERGQRTDEAIEVIRELWTMPTASHHGRFFQFDDIALEPRPLQSPHPPIWIGGRPGGIETGPDGKPRYKSKQGAMARTAKYGDGWCPLYMTTDMYRDSVTEITTIAEQAGRDISGMQWALTTFWQMGDSYDAALEVAKSRQRYGRDLSARIARYDILGRPSDVIARLEQFVHAGVRYFICNWSCDPQEVPRHLETMARDVIPHFR